MLAGGEYPFWEWAMQVIVEAVALGSTLDLPRDLLFDTLAKTAVVAPAHIGKLAGLRAIKLLPTTSLLPYSAR